MYEENVFISHFSLAKPWALQNRPVERQGATSIENFLMIQAKGHLPPPFMVEGRVGFPEFPWVFSLIMENFSCCYVTQQHTASLDKILAFLPIQVNAMKIS